MGKCKGCGREIIWIMTRSGKCMPCDPELAKAVELLQMNYQCAKQMGYVQRPLPFALYCTWKTVDGKWGVSPIDEMKGDRQC